MHRTVVLRDRFGEYGLIAFGLLVPDPAADPEGPPRLEVDTLLMSCRAIGRTVEHALVASLLQAARAQGAALVRARYAPTAKNALVADLWPAMGVPATGEADADGERTFEVALADWTPPQTFVAVE